MAKCNNKELILENFTKSINKMIATSTNSYDTNGFTKGINFSMYTKEDILDIIASGSSEDLREASLFYLYTSGMSDEIIGISLDIFG
jgi:hypothetical protein